MSLSSLTDRKILSYPRNPSSTPHDRREALSYPEGSPERCLLEDDPGARERVYRWIAVVLTSPRFWSLRSWWPDLVQETTMRILESLRSGRFDPSRNFQLYVQGIARHTALQALGQESALRRRREVRDPPDAADGIEERVIRLQLVRRALDLASDECRQLFRAYFFEERGYADLARGMGIPIGTAKSRLFRCLEAAHRQVFRTARGSALPLPRR
jgi:RNA polymerase sigma factor (sigma-70 family)